MSEKKAKELRLEQPKQVAEIIVKMTSDNTLHIQHPQNMILTINMLLDATRLVIMNDHNNKQRSSLITVPSAGKIPKIVGNN